MSDTRTLYTANAHVTGGRDGAAPEQLFAAGWAACFQGARSLIKATRLSLVCA